jgi:hypothetical protein
MFDDPLGSVQKIIGSVATGSADELDRWVKELRDQIDTGYYEGRGDTLFEFVAKWIENFYEENK